MNLDSTVLHHSGDGSNCDQNRCRYGDHDANRDRNLENSVVMVVFHHNSSDVAIM